MGRLLDAALTIVDRVRAARLHPPRKARFERFGAIVQLTVPRALVFVESTWPGAAVRISAQSRLEAFYASLGFVAVGPPYLEDGVDHTEMLRPAGRSPSHLSGA